ncbi:MAG: 3-deoxy-D-manno-octulosonic acid transferase [Planctomycetes bacterium]|nr:3-deoxy-D-manno-octulosonic acid transferase [Planctomycetota bacterium]
MKFIADLVYFLAVLIISPMVLYRVIRHRRYRTGWGQRFGKIIRKNPERKCIWLHAVSVGEVNAARTIIEELENKFTNFEIVISTTTDTGFARANALFDTKHTVIYFPLDFSIIMQRAFEKIQPAVCLLMELEIWPNFVRIAKQSNIPVVVVNGRISDKSFSRYKKIKPIAKTIFQKLTLILSQTEQYAKRFIEIGCPAEKVFVTGSLKYDTAQITNKVDGSDELASQLKIENERLWLAGATGPGEEGIILDIFKDLIKQQRFADLRLVIVPRKPERFDEVAELIRQKGFDFIRYSSVKNTNTPHWEKPSVILGDTMGDLRKFYSLATVIFVGRSLVPMGGSDMAEAAALGKPTMFGPFAFNFKHTVDALLKDNGAIMAKDKQDLFQAIQKCLTDTDFANQIAQNGREVIRKNQGATKKTIDQITKLLTIDL